MRTTDSKAVTATRTLGRMRQLACAAAATAVAVGLVAASARADSVALHASRYQVLAECAGTYDIEVLDWAGYGPALYVYDGGELIMADWVTESVTDDGRVETTSFKTDASVFDGGASLRIRSRDRRIPQTAGTAFLTFNGGNARLRCSIY